MLLRPRYGRIGMVVMPHFYFLEMGGPLLEIMGYTVFILTLLAGWMSLTYVMPRVGFRKPLAGESA